MASNFTTTTAANTTLGASVTLYQAANNQYVTTPPITAAAPTSGCILLSQTPTTLAETYATTTLYDPIPSGLYCTCANGDQAGTSISADTKGTQYIYCADTIGNSAPIATATPTSSPGQANNTDVSSVAHIDPPSFAPCD